MVIVEGIRYAVAVAQVVKTTVLKEDCLEVAEGAQMMERHVRLRVWRLEQQEKGSLHWMEGEPEELVDAAAVELLNAAFRWWAAVARMRTAGEEGAGLGTRVLKGLPKEEEEVAPK